MPEGWKLNEGTIRYEIATEDELWTVVVKTLSSQSKKTTTYKFALMRSILENLYHTSPTLSLSFPQIAESFARLYWNLVIRNGYTQGYQSSIEKELRRFQSIYDIPEGVSFDALQYAERSELIKKIETTVVNRYVVGALYEDTEALLYGFSKKEKKISLTLRSWEFLVKHQTSIFKMVNYELAKFLQGLNSSSTKEVILAEIENLTKRESLHKYKEMILTYSGDECFYTEQQLNRNKRGIAVDHFVPWSFIHSDDLWNFVLTSQSVNSRKGSKLPAEKYLYKLHKRNQYFIEIGDVYVKTEMELYNIERLKSLYQYAAINGYERNWFP